jgi:deoxyadenosine/deoxycytidine kinase
LIGDYVLPIAEAEDRPLLLLLEGIVGAGKTTATLSIAEVMGLVPLLEPVNSNPYLDDFYKSVQGGVKTELESAIQGKLRDSTMWDKGAMAATIMSEQIGDELQANGLTDSMVPAFMQLHLLTKRFALYQAAVHGMPIAKALGHPACGAILDRSLPGDTVFARMNAAEGNIKPREFSSYFSHWQTMQNFLPYAHAMIFLRVTPKEAKRRCDKRGRPEEIKRTGGFPLDYMTKLHDAYEELIDWSEKRMRVVEINYNDPVTPISLDSNQGRVEYPMLKSMYQTRGVPMDKWPKVLPLSEAKRLVEKIRNQLPEQGFWDRTPSMVLD